MIIEDQNITYINCVICGGVWSRLEDEHFRDDKIMWCCNGHDTIWYYQDKDGTCSFDMEVNNLHGNDYDVRWNCQCMAEECRGKNVIYMTYDYGDDDGYDATDGVIRFCTKEEMPFNISRENLFKLIKDQK